LVKGIFLDCTTLYNVILFKLCYFLFILEVQPSFHHRCQHMNKHVRVTLWTIKFKFATKKTPPFETRRYTAASEGLP
jgi:hypothetical protein